MPYKNMWESKGLLTKCDGILSCDDIVSFINEMCGYSDYDTIKYRIIDLSSVSETTINLDNLAMIIAHDIGASKINSRLKLALVVNNEDMQALASLYKHRAAVLPWKVEIFTLMNDARQWIS